MSSEAGGLRVGLAGLGRMGTPMARNILAAGFPLTVFNRTAARCEPLVAAGARQASTPAELAAASDVVVTMVADGAAARALLEGPDGILAGADASREGNLVLAEMSTIGPLAARELSALCAERGVAMIDAPVSGSTAVAEAAALAIVVGGEASAFERARPVLAAMSKVQFHLGPAGAGAAMKLGLNVIIASNAQAISEALVLAESSGIERAAAYDVIAGSVVGSSFVDYKRDAFLDPEGTPTGFALELMVKDLSLALGLGERAGVPLLGASASAQGVSLAAGLEGPGEDLVRIADALRRIGANDNPPRLFPIGAQASEEEGDS